MVDSRLLIAYDEKVTEKRTAVYYFEPSSGREPAREWISNLRDTVGRSRILVRIARAETGNFGDHRNLAEGISELKIPHGPGYRVYYALEGQEIILLLVAGDKSSQSADIEKAKAYLREHQLR